MVTPFFHKWKPSILFPKWLPLKSRSKLKNVPNSSCFVSFSSSGFGESVYMQNWLNVSKRVLELWHLIMPRPRNQWNWSYLGRFFHFSKISILAMKISVLAEKAEFSTSSLKMYTIKLQIFLDFKVFVTNKHISSSKKHFKGELKRNIIQHILNIRHSNFLAANCHEFPALSLNYQNYIWLSLLQIWPITKIKIKCILNITSPLINTNS